MSYQIKRTELYEFLSKNTINDEVMNYKVNMHTDIGEGKIKEVPISKGLTLYIIDWKIYKDLKVIGTFEKEALMFSSIYEGDVNYEDLILKQKFNFKEKETNISYSENEKGCEYYKKGQNFKYVTLFCDNTFISQHKIIKNTFNKKLKKDHFRYNSVNINSHIIANEIFNNPYKGDFQKFFFENKAMDLIFFNLNEYINQNKKLENRFLNEEDILRIKKAKDIILENYLKPLSINQLSRKVAINEFKLKKGFKLIYNTTIFNFLSDFRLNHAYQLLKENNYSIKEISHKVGYKYQSSFTNAFIKKFGILPRNIIKSKKYY